MAVRLQSSFQQLATINHDLEDRVQMRTRELQQANHELQRLASIDGLTQLANRRCFDEYFTTCWTDAHDRAQPLAIALCDIDHFKQFNDTYGHQAGDDCLRQVAQAIERAVLHSATGELAGGRTALAARYGGEEFVILLPNTNQDQARDVVEAVQAEVQYLAIPHGRSSATNIVSLSLGVTVMIPGTISTQTQALVAADRALYAAKRAGRNGYCFAPDCVQAPAAPIKPASVGDDRLDHADRFDHADLIDHADHADRFDHIDHADRFDHADLIDHADRVDRFDHADLIDHADRADRANQVNSPLDV
jgi:diguanylate cyclase (GGDEF)-like protein